MSSVFFDTQGALEVRLNSFPESLPISWPNRLFALEDEADYDPSNPVYLRASFLSGDTEQRCLGREGKDETFGIFQVDVFVPKGAGRTCIPDQLADHFYRESLTQNSTSIRIMNVSIGPIIDDTNYIFTPVSIEWHALTEAR